VQRKMNEKTPPMLVIIAALNEEAGIGPSLAELQMILRDAKYLVVDGHSTDRTVKIAKDMGAEILFQDESGKGEAIAKAINHVNLDEIKYVIFTDADYTYSAKSLPEMIQILERNDEVGMVSGNRFNHSLDLHAMKSPFFVGNRFLAWAQRILNGVHLVDPLTGLRVIRWNIIKGWKPRSKGFDIEAELNHRVERQGYTIQEISISYRARLGAKKLKLKDGFTILKRIILESLYSSLRTSRKFS
jgi:glycosyltransferase involved in cell wall biosynthesis